MIVSVSRRSDIPALYAPWFFKRLEQGFALVRNPVNPKQVSRVFLTPQAVTGFVFWSKNPQPMLENLARLKSYPFYFQFTLTPYGRKLEPGLPDKRRIVETFLRLSEKIGSDRVIWRYDPVLIGKAWPVSRHAEAFDALARALSGATSRAVFSIVDGYAHLRTPMRGGVFAAPDAGQMRFLAESFAKSAKCAGMTLETCAETMDLSGLGIAHGRCVDAALLRHLGAAPEKIKKDPAQRPACGCAASVDIGAYDTCRLGCRYCYANHSAALLRRRVLAHDPDSPLLTGALLPEDRVHDRGAPPAAQQIHFLDGDLS